MHARRTTLTLGSLLLTLVLPMTAVAHRVELILDGSGSMWGRAGDEEKIVAAKRVLKNLIEQIELAPDSSLSLIAYGHRSKGDCADIERFPTVPYAERTNLFPLIDQVSPKGKTPIADALQAVGEALKEQETTVSVVLVSDGLESCGKDPCAVAQELRDLYGINVMIHVVGFDIQEGQEQLECIARKGGGRYFSAADPAELSTAFEDVKAELTKADTATASPPPPPPAPAPAPALTKDVLFEDHFERDELGEAYEILDPDPERFALLNGKALSVATRPRRNRVYLKKTFPGDFTAIIVVNMQVVRDSGAELAYMIDDENSLAVGVSAYASGPYLYFRKKVSGKDNDFTYRDPLGDRNLREFSSESEVWYFQLERKGIKFTARASADGDNWQALGTHTFLNKKAGQFGFAAESHGIEYPAEFDDFVVQASQ